MNSCSCLIPRCVPNLSVTHLSVTLHSRKACMYYFTIGDVDSSVVVCLSTDALDVVAPMSQATFSFRPDTVLGRYVCYVAGLLYRALHPPTRLLALRTHLLAPYFDVCTLRH